MPRQRIWKRDDDKSAFWEDLFLFFCSFLFSLLLLLLLLLSVICVNWLFTNIKALLAFDPKLSRLIDAVTNCMSLTFHLTFVLVAWKGPVVSSIPIVSGTVCCVFLWLLGIMRGSNGTNAQLDSEYLTRKRFLCRTSRPVNIAAVSNLCTQLGQLGYSIW
jgi:hypothetical protein